MALLQFALVFGNDHFVLPVPMPVGAVFTTSQLLTFGMTLSLAPRLTYRLTGTTEAIGINHDELDQSPPPPAGPARATTPNLREAWCASKTAPRC